MHMVRQTAMVSYLKTGKTQGSAKSRAGSDASDGSQSGGERQSRPIAAARKKSSSRKKKQSPPQHSPKGEPQEGSSPDTRIVKAKSLQSVIPQTPIVVPLQPEIRYPFDEFRMPPLVSIGVSLDPFRTMFQSNDSRVSVERLKHHCRTYFGSRGLGRLWIPKCLDHHHTFLSTLYMAAAHDDTIYGREVESLETAALRQDVIHHIGANLTDPEKMVDDSNIIAVSQLILGEVIGRTETSMAFHQNGIEQMIKQRGGLNQLGMNGLLASAVSWAHLATAVLREGTPSPMYVEYCASNSVKRYPLHVTIPESPLYCPHGKFVTIERSKAVKYQPNTLKLLNDMRTMIGDFLRESRKAHWNSEKLTAMYNRISQYQPLQQMSKDHVSTTEDWKYEAIRITAIVQAHALANRTPISEAILHACPTRRSSSAIYTPSLASQSTESLPSPLDISYSTPVTEYSTSPSYSTSFRTSFSSQHSGFPFSQHRSSDASTHSQYPVFSSQASTSASTCTSSETQRQHQRRFTTLSDVKDALEKSNLSYCWGDMAGVLLWIGLVMGAASYHETHKPTRRYFSALTIRACIMLCFEHPQAMHATMLQMTQVVEALGATSNDSATAAQLVRRDVDAPRKRSRPA